MDAALQITLILSVLVLLVAPWPLIGWVIVRRRKAAALAAVTEIHQERVLLPAAPAGPPGYLNDLERELGEAAALLTARLDRVERIARRQLDSTVRRAFRRLSLTPADQEWVLLGTGELAENGKPVSVYIAG